MNTLNDQLAGWDGSFVIVLKPRLQMTKAEALRHACWLLVLSQASKEEIAQQMEAIEGT